MCATGCHVSIIGQITPDELREKFIGADITNGLINRFLPICSKRSKILPFPVRVPSETLAPIAKRLRIAIEDAQRTREVHRTAEADALWGPWYEAYPVGNSKFDALTARGPTHVNRLNLIYALLDGKQVEPTCICEQGSASGITRTPARITDSATSSAI